MGVSVSGTGTGSDADGKPRVGTATEETRWALENLKQILEDAGSSLERVVQVFCLVQDKKYVLTPLLAYTAVVPARVGWLF